VALDLVEAHRVLRDPATLRRAQRLFEFVEHGWDRESRHPCPGGVFWTRAAGVSHRNTVSTANGAVLALALYRETGSRHYLRWAQTMYEWVHRCMAAPNGLFWDHIDLKGRVDATHWSYNQGIVITADTALYQITHDRRFLRAAEAVADAALDWFEDAADTEPPEFMSVFYRSLLRLQAEDPDRNYFTAAQAYADTAWGRYRVGRTALFSFGKAPDLLGQSAMVQLLADLAIFGRR
jgi:predicted alpha-1,6-mannanase (GH76 family)